MESEDSRDDSSGSDINDEGPKSPDSGNSDYDDNAKSENSRSRSGSSSSSRPVSALSCRSSESSPEGRKPGRNNIQSPGSDRSRSSSSEKSDRSRSSSPEQKGGRRSSSVEEDEVPSRSRPKQRNQSSSAEENDGRSRSSSIEEVDQSQVRHVSKEKQQSRSSSVEEEKIRSKSSSIEDDRVKSNEENIYQLGTSIGAQKQMRSSSLEEQTYNAEDKSNEFIQSVEENLHNRSILRNEQGTKSAPLEGNHLFSSSNYKEKETDDSKLRTAQKTSEHITLSTVAGDTSLSRSKSIENENMHNESGSSGKLQARSRSSSLEEEQPNRSPNLEREETVRSRSNSFDNKKGSRTGHVQGERSSDREQWSRSSFVDTDKTIHPSNSVEIEKHVLKQSNIETEVVFDRPSSVEKQNIRVTLLNNIEVGKPQSSQNDSPHSPPYPDRQQIHSPDPPKSPDDSPHSSHSSSPDHRSPGQDYRSFKSGSSYRKSVSQQSELGHRGRSKSSSSDSSNSSVDSSCRKNKNFRKNTVDTMPEAISDGDMEIDQGKDDSTRGKATNSHSTHKSNNELNMVHEDLSDVSDLEDSMGAHFDQDDCTSQQEQEKHDERQNYTMDSKGSVKQESTGVGGTKKVDPNMRPEEAEEQLDFEAEDGECGESENKEKEEAEERSAAAAMEAEEKQKEEEERKKKEREDLEEGEVTDEDDVRPEETEPRPVCRFFSRGQCTWGASCRFLHPGVTDKGNYTMFDLVRPLMPGEFRDDRMFVGAKVEAPVVESAWERGLRTAKEMVRKSLKRKEQDMDFEEKKMNLSLAQEEFDKENGYYGRVPSPEPRYVRHVEFPPMTRPPPPEDYYAPVMMPPRRHVMYEPEYVGRERPGRGQYREPPVAPPPHRGPPPHHAPHHHPPPEYYAEDVRGGGDQMRPDKRSAPPVPHPIMGGERSSRGHAPPDAGRPKREVIVQRAEEVRGRGDEWSDPWMRLKSPAGRRNKERKRSYSSGSSYSSSSSSRSSSGSSRSSYRSRSRSPRRRRRSRSRRSRHVSPSVIVSERKAANERAALMNPPAPKRRATSPTMMRVNAAANPPAPSRSGGSKLAMAAALARMKSRGVARLSRSSSGSSSSSSDSDSSDSSSSSSRDASPTPPPHHAASAIRRPPGMDISLAKAMDALKGSSLEKKQIKLNLKTPMGIKGKSAGDSGDTVRKLEMAAVAAAAAQGKKRQANSPPQGESKSKKATSRREELLKQLKAVEDAIAKKRSKVN